MGKEMVEDLILPDEVEGSSVTVEDSIEPSEKEKELSRKQNEFEFKSKESEPEVQEEIKKKEKKSKIIDWIIISAVVLGLVFLGISLL